jgi:hypothetical protein
MSAPESSTAAQMVEFGQETAVGAGPTVVAEGCPGSIRIGPDHAVPFH